jgi:spermidine synthase
VTFSSGSAELLADLDRPGGWLLLLDRIRQSYVDLDDPTYLDFEYIQAFADIVDALPEGPLAVTHVGGGAATFARYVAAKRPGSPQLVLEPDEALTALVRSRLPFPRGARIRVRAVDGRTGVAALRSASADVLVVDAFLGGRVPAELTTVEFLADAMRVLGDGVLLMNVADGAPGLFVRRVAATLRTAFANVAVIADPAVLKFRRFGNVVLTASADALPVTELAAASARAMFPRRVLHAATLTRWLAGALPIVDADAIRSPAPPDGAWRVEHDD